MALIGNLDGHLQGTDTALGTLSTKNPPIDADKAIYRDSTATDALVTSTWTQVKAFLKTYFDTLYLALAGGTVTGDLIFGGAGSGLPYGSCSDDGVELAWSQVATTDTWYDISDTGMGDGQLNLVTHDGSGKLTVTKAGVYLINYYIGIEVGVANKHIHTAISIDGTENAQGQAHYENKAISQEFSLSGTAILSLTVNQTINVSVKLTDVVGATITVDGLNLTAVMVGG